MTLQELLDETAADLPGMVAAPGDGGSGRSYRVGEVEVAVLTADGAGEFRLDPAVAAAARRTPDTEASDRGSAWVRFAPAVLDDQAADRARAWLMSAARRAGTG